MGTAPLRAEEIRIDLDKPGDSHVKPRIDASGFAFHLQADGYLQKLEPTTIRIETQQKGRWSNAKFDAGRYLQAQFNTEDPRQIRVESRLKFDLPSGERRFVQERDAIQKEAQQQTGGKDSAAMTKARSQLLIEHIAVVRAENIKAGADPRGKGTPHAPPLPRQPLSFEKLDALERILREQCRWRSVAEVFQATGFPPPDERDHPDFAASATMAEEIEQATKGIKFTPRFLSDGQYNALVRGSRYQFSALFVPELSQLPSDVLWKTAPAVRLADGLVKRAQLEGSLDRQRGQTVEWWRVECDAPARIQPRMTKGDGDCFWTWVEGPNAHVRYIRVLLHSPGTRYRLALSLSGASQGEELILYDGPLDAPTEGPF